MNAAGEESGELVEVRLLQLPVALWERAQEHGDELIREFTLMAADGDRGAALEVPARLTGLIQQLTARYDGFTAEQEVELANAAAGGLQEIELTFQVPAAAAKAAADLGQLLDAADDYCRAGQHLLTLATPAQSVAFRRWYLDQFIGQIGGALPTPWPEWAAVTAR